MVVVSVIVNGDVQTLIQVGKQIQSGAGIRLLIQHGLIISVIIQEKQFRLILEKVLGEPLEMIDVIIVVLIMQEMLVMKRGQQ